MSVADIQNRYHHLK